MLEIFESCEETCDTISKGMALTLNINANQQRCDIRKLWYLIIDQVNAPLFFLIKSRVRKKQM
jgi:hypothetical protein